MSPNDLLHWIGPLLGIVATGLGGWIARKIGLAHDTQAALHRAQILAVIAQDAAALVVSLNPTAAWSALLELTVKQIAQAAGLSTTDQQAIMRAAASALTALGKSPGTAATPATP
jgi:hypothetical protein